MNRVIARRIYVNISGLRVIRKSFCSDAAAKVSGANCDPPSTESEVKQSFINNDHQYDVAIVGGGMVGMALACSLASTPLTKHLNVAIIDSNPALGKLDSIKKEDPPDPRVSTVTPATISFFKDVGAWQYVEQHRHAYFDKMQVWDYTGFGYTRYNARDVNKEVLGCVVENKVLHRSLLLRMQNTDFRKTIYPSRLTSMALLPSSSPVNADGTSSTTSLFTRGRLAKLELSDGNSLYAKLVVGADGGKSRVRELAGFKTTGWSYSQNAIICTIEHANENHCAWQRFLPAGPIALLPIGDNFSNIVWTMNPKEASDCKLMNEDDFVKTVNHALDYGYGPHPKSSSLGSADMWSWLQGDATISAREHFEVPPKVIKLASERMVFPLSLKHANDYVSKRVVLIGDAAHTVHPLAGQGVNLGFGDASTVSKIIAEGIAVGADIGEVSLLRKYEAERKPANIVMMAVLDGFQKAYSVDFGPLNILRAAAFNSAQYISPLKRSIISYASGEQRLPLPLPLFSLKF
ncbi:Ubiquinone biosynthesis monooxygenase COQ6, mitochondrial [Melia azedarach]|uniref:Ubiquinone biosynthesis monooxygenase COQ6, mitochondrial n=1 Tax=Melia azedarach TaxID=155640 RepID=A0ACC1YHT1_MELAZ|nr:Ubiquinone biosynthesis monooxygenase COQ6, mitochondrial [Melia azedarach]